MKCELCGYPDGVHAEDCRQQLPCLGKEYYPCTKRFRPGCKQEAECYHQYNIANGHCICKYRQYCHTPRQYGQAVLFKTPVGDCMFYKMFEKQEPERKCTREPL